MKNEKIIAHTKKEQNLFTFNLAQPEKVMAMTGQRQLTHFISKNKCIQLWHRYLTDIINACIVSASKLVDGFALTSKNTKYNLADIIINSDNSNKFDLSNFDNLTLQQTQFHKAKTADATAIVSQTKAINNSNILDKLCTLYIENKSTRVIR